MSKSNEYNIRPSLLDYVFAVFLLFKLGEIGTVANWNWFFIFLPLIIGILVRLIFVLVSEGIKIKFGNSNKKTFIFERDKLPSPEQIKKYQQKKIPIFKRLKRRIFGKNKEQSNGI